MSSAKLVLCFVLAAVSLSACGISAKPEIGSAPAQTSARNGLDDGRKLHAQCLRQDHIPVLEFARTWMQVGSKPSGPTIRFMATPGAAQNEQIQGLAPGAEVIGSALVYPNQATDQLMTTVEGCVAKGVTG